MRLSVTATVVLSLALVASAAATQERPPRYSPDAMRTLYFKLPLTQPEFHWSFLNRDAFLSGRLTLRIIRDGTPESIVVFEDGVVTPGWAPIVSNAPEEIYFGFDSTSRYLTSANDSLEIELVVRNDLAGVGAMISGILPAGTYTATGSYAGLFGYASDQWLEFVASVEQIPVEELAAMPETQALIARLNEETRQLTAFMECWRRTWDLEPTGSGWLSPEQMAAYEARMAEDAANEARMEEMRATIVASGGPELPESDLGTDGRPCA